jgi:amino acid adenylation domain-containing protein
MAGYFCSLLTRFIKEPHQRLSVPMLPEKVLARLYERFNSVDYPQTMHLTILDCIAQHIDHFGHHTAVSFGKTHVSYERLGIIIDHLAHQLQTHCQRERHQSIQPNTLIMVMLDRSIDMITTILAIFKCGGAYLPIDVHFPQERIKRLYDRANPLLVVKHPQYAAMCNAIFNQSDRSQLLIVAETDTLDPCPVTPVFSPVTPTDLAYVMYTSGSTGEPKGVMIEQGSVVNRLLWMQSTFHLSPADVVLQKTPYNFDVSVWELLWPLMSGAQLVFAPPDAHRDPDALIELIAHYQVTTIHFVPSMLTIFLQAFNKNRLLNREKTHHLKRIFSSGETLDLKTKNILYATLPIVEFYNLYGPTEATVDVSWFDCSRALSPDAHSVPIGKPIYNTQLYVLDSYDNLCPTGVIGELYIGGYLWNYTKNSYSSSDLFIDSYEKTDNLYFRL